MKEEKIIETKILTNNINDTFIIISIREYYSTKPDDYETKIAYLHKEDILFVINTFRKIGKEGYDRWGGVKEELEHNDDDFIMIKINSNDRSPCGLAELSIYNEKSGPSICFHYDVRDPLDKESSLYKFLKELEKYVPEKDKNEIIPEW